MDLSFDTPMGALSVRVGGIIVRNNSVLMTRDTRSDYRYIVGGRVQYGETTLDAVCREVFEETGYHMEIDRLGFVSEIQFMSENLVDKGQFVYELGYYYYMKVPEYFEITEHEFVDSGLVTSLEWVSLDDTDKVHPGYILEELKHPTNEVKHIVLDERK